MMNNIQDIINDLDNRDFDFYLNKMMDKVPGDIDKREGSILYDAIAPAAMAMAEENTLYINYLQQLHISTATGEFLDAFAADKGTTREPATYAKATATIIDENKNVVTSVDVNDEYASLGSDPIFYHVVEKNADGSFLLQANEPGTYANQYSGQIVPVTANDSVNWAEITEVSVPAKDSEEDDSLRDRLLSPNNYIAYGGNQADYIKMLDKIGDVGAAQVYQGSQGGGNVKLFILDNNFNAASSALVNEVKNIIDPSDRTGQGVGLAPIGQAVEVATTELFNIDVNSNVVTDGKLSKDIINANIEKNLTGYFNGLRHIWNKLTNGHYSMTVYRSQILAIILQTDHVINAELPTLNNKAEDITMTFNAEKSQLPVLKDVIIND